MYINLYQPVPSIFNPNLENCRARASMERADTLTSRYTLRVARPYLQILVELDLACQESATCIVVFAKFIWDTEGIIIAFNVA